MMDRHWFARLIIATWAGSLPFVGYLTPDSLMGHFLPTAGVPSWVASVVVAITALIAVADVLVNDLLPPKFHTILMHQRHVNFMVMSISLLYLGGVFAVRTGAYTTIPSFYLPALFAIVVTWLDLFTRPRPIHKTKATA